MTGEFKGERDGSWVWKETTPPIPRLPGSFIAIKHCGASRRHRGCMRPWSSSLKVGGQPLQPSEPTQSDQLRFSTSPALVIQSHKKAANINTIIFATAVATFSSGIAQHGTQPRRHPANRRTTTTAHRHHHHHHHQRTPKEVPQRRRPRQGRETVSPLLPLLTTTLN